MNKFWLSGKTDSECTHEFSLFFFASHDSFIHSVLIILPIIQFWCGLIDIKMKPSLNGMGGEGGWGEIS